MSLADIANILASWNALVAEMTSSLGELVKNLVNTLRDFEKATIIVPIAAEVARLRGPLSSSAQSGHQVSYSNVWHYICSSGRLQQILT